MIRVLIAVTFLSVLFVVPCFATVNVVVYTYDGIVVATDSRVIMKAVDNKMRIVSEFGEKIIQVGSHVAVAFSGVAHLFDTEAELRSIGSLIEEYKSRSGISDSSRINPRSVVLGIDSLLISIYKKRQKLNYDRGLLQLVVCGYDTTGKRRIDLLSYPKLRKSVSEDRKYDVYGQLDSITTAGMTGAFVKGQTKVWTRLIKGHDQQLLKHKWFRDVETVTIDSLDSTKVDTTVKREELNLDDLRYQIRYDLMTLQDAIDYSIFIVRATIESQRFNQASVQGVGGAIDIAIITPDGFRWIQHKQLQGEGPIK